MNETKTIHEAIYTFLKNGSLDYDYGVSLLREVCNKKMLIQSLSRKKSAANFDKLNYELEKSLDESGFTKEITVDVKIVTKKDIKVANGSVISSKAPHPKKENSSKYSAADDTLISSAIDRLLAEKRDLYAQRDHLHPQLSLVKDDSERHDIAKKIQLIQPQLDKLQTQIDMIKSNGHLPTEVAAKQMTGATFQRFKMVQSYIRRYKSLTAAAKTIHDKEKYTALLEKYQTELNSFE